MTIAYLKRALKAITISMDAAAQLQKIAGLVAFYDEKVDVHVDGVLQERPRTKFS